MAVHLHVALRGVCSESLCGHDKTHVCRCLCVYVCRVSCRVISRKRWSWAKLLGFGYGRDLCAHVQFGVYLFSLAKRVEVCCGAGVLGCLGVVSGSGRQKGTHS